MHQEALVASTIDEAPCLVSCFDDNESTEYIFPAMLLRGSVVGPSGAAVLRHVRASAASPTLATTKQ